MTQACVHDLRRFAAATITEAGIPSLLVAVPRPRRCLCLRS